MTLTAPGNRLKTQGGCSRAAEGGMVGPERGQGPGRQGHAGRSGHAKNEAPGEVSAEDRQGGPCKSPWLPRATSVPSQRGRWSHVSLDFRAECGPWFPEGIRDHFFSLRNSQYTKAKNTDDNTTSSSRKGSLPALHLPGREGSVRGHGPSMPLLPRPPQVLGGLRRGTHGKQQGLRPGRAGK